MNRILENLLRVYQNNKADPFVQYGIAIEYRNLGEMEKALEFFNGVHQKFPEYIPNYFHFGQALERLGQPQEAARVYREGIALADKVGDEHAAAELKGALELL